MHLSFNSKQGSPIVTVNGPVVQFRYNQSTYNAFLKITVIIIMLCSISIGNRMNASAFRDLWGRVMF